MPLESPECPRQVMRGRVIGVGTRGWTGRMRGLAGMGVRMGVADMEDGPTDRFGIEPIPVSRKQTSEEEKILCPGPLMNQHRCLVGRGIFWKITKACRQSRGGGRAGDGRLLHDGWQRTG